MVVGFVRQPWIALWVRFLEVRSSFFCLCRSVKCERLTLEKSEGWSWLEGERWSGQDLPEHHHHLLQHPGTPIVKSRTKRKRDQKLVCLFVASTQTSQADTEKKHSYFFDTLQHSGGLRSRLEAFPPHQQIPFGADLPLGWASPRQYRAAVKSGPTVVQIETAFEGLLCTIGQTIAPVCQVSQKGSSHGRHQKVTGWVDFRLLSWQLVSASFKLNL